MFHVYEMVETYDKGFENLFESMSVECETYEEALAVYEESVALHIEAGHEQVFKNEKSACFSLFNGGKYAVASFSILIV